MISRVLTNLEYNFIIFYQSLKINISWHFAFINESSFKALIIHQSHFEVRIIADGDPGQSPQENNYNLEV